MKPAEAHRTTGGRRSLIAAALLLWAASVGAQGYPQSPREYLTLMDANGDGRISEAEYLEYMSRGFRGMDANGDGVLESDELPGGRGKPITLKEFQANLRRQFHHLDSNHDGSLNAKELSQPPG